MGQKLIDSELKLGANTLLREAIESVIPFGNVLSGADVASASVNSKSMNNIKETGIYYGYNMTNAAELNISTFFVMSYSKDWVMQLQFVMSYTYTRVYIRRFHSGNTWSAWERFF